MRIADRQPVATAVKVGQNVTPQASAADPVDSFQSSTVNPNETGLDVLKAAAEVFRLPVDQAYGATKDFIAAHPFFHHGLMEVPIGGGKHFRNVPFIGPYHVAHGFVSGDSVEVAKGREVTRGTWDAA